MAALLVVRWWVTLRFQELIIGVLHSTLPALFGFLIIREAAK
jgi:hypothetical protein